MHTAQFEAPKAEFAVPGGQGVGLVEAKGHTLPLGQSSGFPEAQKKPAGQGSHAERFVDPVGEINPKGQTIGAKSGLKSENGQ